MPVALISVSDKLGVVEFGRGLVELGWKLISTGGTKAALEAGGVPVVGVSEFTGAPEVFGGRVKSLHPKIHGGILGRREEDQAEADANGIEWIDLVACNLYPFENTVSGEVTPSMAAAIEKIDIGGPSMVRSAAKNHKYVTVICDPADYTDALERLESGRMDDNHRLQLATKAFGHTALYDGIISTWLDSQSVDFSPSERALPIRKKQGLRYGENPHQSAVFYAEPGATGRSLARAVVLQGKPLSFNNFADLDGALRSVFEYKEPASVVVKHMNPCGAAVHEAGCGEAFTLALSADPISAYGGILAFNRALGAEDIKRIFRSKTFFEVIAAPGFSDEAKTILAKRSKLRALELPSDWIDSVPSGQDARRVQGGWLLQDWDMGLESEWTVATKRAPTPEEMDAMRFAWGACRNVKSNAIVLARAEEGGFVLNGVGAGQMSRIDSVNIAIEKATRPVQGSVLASDAFFPFADGVEGAIEAGVSAIVQPGGSIRDEEVIAAADAAGISMVMTGVRHFRH